MCVQALQEGHERQRQEIRVALEDAKDEAAVVQAAAQREFQVR